MNALTELRTLLDKARIRDAIILLNALTEHRFTALYRFDRNILHNLYFFDCENPAQESAPDIPVMASYCVFVRESQRGFTVTNSIEDDRLGDHPKRQVLQSYCGVPMLDKYGRMFGSICHFDFRPIKISDTNVALMEEVGPRIQHLHSTGS